MIAGIEVTTQLSIKNFLLINVKNANNFWHFNRINTTSKVFKAQFHFIFSILVL